MRHSQPQCAHQVFALQRLNSNLEFARNWNTILSMTTICKFITITNFILSRHLISKFRLIGVPTRDSFSSRVLKVCNLSRVEAQYLKTKTCSVEARLPARFELALLLLPAWGQLEPGWVSVPLGIRSIFRWSLSLKLGFVSWASIIAPLRNYPFVFTIYLYVISHLCVILWII